MSATASAEQPAANAATRPTPVFVLGLQRSGTTWLANVLAQHPRVVAVQSADHFGVHESIFFSHFAPAYGDLADDAAFERFVRDFTTSDYYLLTGLPADWLRRRRPRSYPEAFRAVMEELARRAGGADVWVEKSPHHTLLAEGLARDFPDARFVSIVRRTADVIRSRVWASGSAPPPYPRRLLGLARLAWSSVLYARWQEAYCRASERCISTTYEEFRADPERQTRRICDFLGLTFEPRMLELPWARNSSFSSRRDRRRKTLGRLDRAVVHATSALFRALPLAWMVRLHARRQGRRGVEWPDWCWRRRDAGLPTEAGSSASSRRASQP